MELERLIPHHFLKKVFRWLEIIPGPVKWLFGFGLSLLVVKTFEVGVLESLFDGVSLLRVED